MHERALQPVGVEVSGLDLDAAGPDEWTTADRSPARRVSAGKTSTTPRSSASCDVRRRAFTPGTAAARGPRHDVQQRRAQHPTGAALPRRHHYAATPGVHGLRAVRIPAQAARPVHQPVPRYDTLPAASRRPGPAIRHEVRPRARPRRRDRGRARRLRPHRYPADRALPSSAARRRSAASMTPRTGVIDFLFAHSTAADNTYRHAWSTGDVVMWDNGCVLHRADHAGVVGDRVLHRGMVARYPVSATTGARA